MNLNFRADFDANTPIHIQVEQYLRKMVQEERYQNGERLPNETDISKMLGISRSTFRTAMDRLVRDGIVVRKRGIGSFVNHHMISTTLSKWESFSEEMSSKGIEFQTLDKKVSWVYPGEEDAAALNVKRTERICRLERLKGIDGKPIIFFISFFHPRIGIKEDEKFDGRLYEILRKKYHSIPMVSNEEIGALNCNRYLADKLCQPITLPVLFRKRKVLNQTGKILELGYVYCRSDKFVYNIQIRREAKVFSDN